MRKEVWDDFLKLGQSVNNLAKLLKLNAHTVGDVKNKDYTITEETASRVVERIEEIRADETYTGTKLWQKDQPFTVSELLDYDRSEKRLPDDASFYTGQPLHGYALSPDRDGLGTNYWMHTEFSLELIERLDHPLPDAEAFQLGPNSPPGLLHFFGNGYNELDQAFYVSATLLNPFLFTISAVRFPRLDDRADTSNNDEDHHHSAFQLCYVKNYDDVFSGTWTGLDHGAHAGIFRAFLSRDELPLKAVQRLADTIKLPYHSFEAPPAKRKQSKIQGPHFEQATKRSKSRKQ